MLLKVHDICVIRLYLFFSFPICLLTWMNCTPWGSWFPLIDGFLSIWGSDVSYLLVIVYIQVPWIHLCREDIWLMDVLLCVIFFFLYSINLYLICKLIWFNEKGVFLTPYPNGPSLIYNSLLSFPFLALFFLIHKTNQVFLFLCYQAYSHLQSGSDSCSDNIFWRDSCGRKWIYLPWENDNEEI